RPRRWRARRGCTSSAGASLACAATAVCSTSTNCAVAMPCSTPPRSTACSTADQGLHMKKILILGANGFIGHHLTQRILQSTDWHVYAMDMADNRLEELRRHPRLHFFEGDITINREWIEYHVRKCDVLIPLVAIATPATYVREPLRVFELDF